MFDQNYTPIMNKIQQCD